MENAQYTQYFVAFLDILGFKDKVAHSSCEDLLRIFNFLGNMIDIYYGNEFEYLKSNIKTKIMSDSICVYIKTDISNALLELVGLCSAFQSNLLMCNPCIFVRGGITYGNMYIKDDIMFGPALTEAYLLEEKNAKVPRIIMCKSTLDYGKSGMNEEAQHFLDYEIFRDDDAFYAIDYCKFLFVGDYRKKERGQVISLISNCLEKTTDESIRQKNLYVEKLLSKHL